MSLLDEERVGVEFVLGTVFQDEQAAGFEKGGQNEFRYEVELLQFIRRVRKDDAEALFASAQEVEDVHSQRKEVVYAEFLCRLSLKVHALGVLVYGGYLSCSAGYEFEADGSRAAEQIQDIDFFELHSVAKNVEESFSCHVRGRTYGQIGRRVEASASEVSCYYSHSYAITKK